MANKGVSRLALRKWAGDFNRLLNSSLSTPNWAVRLILGNMLVKAMPTSAWAACRAFSAALMSGRRSSKEDDSPAGSSWIRRPGLSLAFRRSMWWGKSPVSKAISFSFVATAFSSSGTSVAVRANSTCACWYEVSEVRPPSKRILASRTPSWRAWRVCLTIESSWSSATSSK